MTDEEKLQKYLPLIRNAAGWTAEELGSKIGVTKQTISNLENMKTKMSKTQYLAIQMVISQKIATTPDDLTLANIMKLMADTDEETVINYEAVQQAMDMAKSVDEQKNILESTGAALGMATGVAGGLGAAMSLLGLGPVGAVSAAVLGATIAPWLTRATMETMRTKDDTETNLDKK